MGGGGSSEEINEIKYNLNNLSNLYFKEHYNTNIAYVNTKIYEMFLINNNYDDINYDNKIAYLYTNTVTLSITDLMEYYRALINNIWENFRNVYLITNTNIDKIIYENEGIGNPFNDIEHSDISMLNTQTFKSMIINFDVNFNPEYFNFVGYGYSTTYDLIKFNYTNLITNFSNITVSTFVLSVKENRTISTKLFMNCKFTNLNIYNLIHCLNNYMFSNCEIENYKFHNDLIYYFNESINSGVAINCKFTNLDIVYHPLNDGLNNCCSFKKDYEKHVL